MHVKMFGASVYIHTWIYITTNVCWVIVVLLTGQ